jgi:membrane protease YdiL (CAAX protease family)
MSKTPSEGAPGPVDRAFLRIGIETIAVLLATCGYALVYYGFRSNSASAHATVEGLIEKAVQDLGVAGLILVLVGAKPRSWLLASSRQEWLREAWWGAILAGGMWTIGLVLPMVAHWLGLKSGPSYWATSFRYPGVAATFIATSPISCMRQELLFRFYFQPRFAKLLGGKEDLAILAVSWLFAAVHGYPQSATFEVFFTGMLLGLVFRFSRRVPRLVIGHTLYNVAACLLKMP